MPIENLSVLFCEDIRDEVGGRSSLMGVMSGNLIVTSLPTTLGKLCVTFAADITDVNQVHVVAELLSDQQSVSLPPGYNDVVDNPDKALNYWNMRVNLIMHNFQIDHFQALTARLKVDDQEVTSRLMIMLKD